jgi:hypothetical protein
MVQHVQDFIPIGLHVPLVITLSNQFFKPQVANLSKVANLKQI